MYTAKINKITECLAYFAAHPNVHGTTLTVVDNRDVRGLDVEQLTWEQIAERVAEYDASGVHLVPWGFVPAAVREALGDSDGCDADIVYLGSCYEQRGVYVQLLRAPSLLGEDDYYASKLADVRAAIKAVA